MQSVYSVEVWHLDLCTEVKCSLCVGPFKLYYVSGIALFEYVAKIELWLLKESIYIRGKAGVNLYATNSTTL